MDLVTIACEQDFDVMRLQAESISKFVEPCTHWVTVNERFPNKKKWREMLETFYTKHKLILMFPKWYEYLHVPDGFSRQQVYKIKMVNYIKDEEFLCLDPKDFFVKSCSTNDWKGVLGCGWLAYDPNWEPVIQRFAKKFNVAPVRENQFASECPFVWRTELVKNLGNIEEFCNWYLNGKCGELVLYSYLANHLIDDSFSPRKFARIFWMGQTVNAEVLTNTYNTDYVKVMGFHRYVRYAATSEQLNTINVWLKSLGLDTPIVKFKPNWFERFRNKRYYKKLNSGKV
jgi:hypothetical protein